MRPNFFLVGAPKCGTTGLSEYLRAHPNIFLTHPKEPFYFADDFPNLKFVKTEIEYENLFRQSQPTHLAAGEASAGYLYSRVALRNIRDYNPHARLLVMLRNPVDLVHAFHSQMVFSFDEDEPEFSEAWNLQPLRARGLRVPPRCRTRQFLQYGKVGLLGDQVESLLQVFSRKQILFLIFDDLLKSPVQVYRTVLDFLELPDDHRTTFPRFNANKTHSLPRLAYLWQRKPSFLRTCVEKLKRQLGGNTNRIEDSFRRLFWKNVKRSPLPVPLRQELGELFSKDILKLGRLTGRDLSAWQTQTKSNCR
ncbi:MAG: hypothetical protein GTO41_03120 [Burkholderiales bacterium]|nr:hypothetical protein [Burkholderiales bacterium]